MIVIGLVGLAGSGKSTMMNYLKEKYGYGGLTFSDAIKEEAKKRKLLKENANIEETKMILSNLGDVWRKETGKYEIVAEKLIEKIKEQKLKNVVVDGARSPAEIELFRKSFEKFYLIYVSTDFDVRFKRRLKDDPNARKENMQERDKNDIEKKGLQEVIEMADFVLDNNGTLKDLQHQIDVIMGSL